MGTYEREINISRVVRTCLLVTLAIVVAGCDRRADKARLQLTQLQLTQLGIPYSGASFIETARNGNVGGVALFLDAGMSRLQARKDRLL